MISTMTAPKKEMAQQPNIKRLPENAILGTKPDGMEEKVGSVCGRKRKSNRQKNSAMTACVALKKR